MGSRNRQLAVVLAVVLVAVAGIVWWRTGTSSSGTSSAGTSSPGTPASGPPAPRPSELYAADGRTLIARFDTGDPRQSCLRAPANDWGFYCEYLVTWWERQAAFGPDPAHRIDRLLAGDYRIVGSLDLPLQAVAKQRVEAALPAGNGKALSVVTVEPGSGLIKAMAVNRPFRQPPSPGPDVPDPVSPWAAAGADAPGPPGSGTFMIFTLAAALEGGAKLDEPIRTERVHRSKYVIDPSSPVACDGGHWCPRNTGDPAYLSGPRTMWEALTHSVVTYFVGVQERIGADKVIDMAERLGIRFDAAPDRGLAEPPNNANWGSFTLGVSRTSALDLADAYATLAADGTHCDPLPVKELTDPSGKPVPGVGPHCASVVRPDVARAAMDAARCPLGDKSAFGDRCGAGKPPAAGVRAVVGRPVAGQFGMDERKTSLALVVAGPQLVTAGTVGSASDRARIAQTGGVIDAVAQTQHSGLAGLPSRDFTAPARPAALGG